MYSVYSGMMIGFVSTVLFSLRVCRVGRVGTNDDDDDDHEFSCCYFFFVVDSKHSEAVVMMKFKRKSE